MSEMVERVAEALFNFEGDGRKLGEIQAELQVFWRDAARVAISSMRESTLAMRMQGEEVCYPTESGEVWKKMIDEALK